MSRCQRLARPSATDAAARRAGCHGEVCALRSVVDVVDRCLVIDAELSVSDPRPLTLLYVGDHDPSGRHMSDADIPGRLDRYSGEADLVRLAVTTRQVATHELPTFSARTKSKDARYRWFVGRHGDACCELDALDPNVLRQVVERAITARIDSDRWARAEITERAEMASLQSFLETWPAHI